MLPHKSSGIPWTDHLYDLEGADSETKGKSQVLYVLVPESGASGTKFRIRAVPSEPGSFLNRHPLPVAWRGLRDAELSHVAGISGCVFVHASGFIGGNTTFEGALAMAKKAVTIE